MTNLLKTIATSVTLAAVFAGGFVVAPQTADAAAWWGDGYRKPEWVVKHGGSIFRYNVINGKAKRYKAMMFRDGKYVEVEFDNDAVFDDAKDGWYDIIFYKCKDSCLPHMTDRKTKIRSSDKKVASIRIQARPGETSHLVFDAAAKRVSIVKRYGYVPPKTPAQIAIEKADAVKGQKCGVRVTEPEVTESATETAPQTRTQSQTLTRFTSPNAAVAPCVK